MSREVDAALETAIEAPVVRPFLAVHIALPDPVYAWTGIGTLSFADSDGVARNWLGAGNLGSIDTIGEGTDGSATGIQVRLNQIPEEFRDDIADQATKGAKFEVYIGALNETFQQIEGTHLLWRGRLDKYEITDGGSELSVTITGENRMRDQGRPAIKRFSDEYQQRKHPGDKFFEFLPRMVEIPILWAKAEQTGAGTAGGGGGGFAGAMTRAVRSM